MTGRMLAGLLALTMVVGCGEKQTAAGHESSGVPTPGKPFANSIGMKLVWVPAGSFLMGSPPAEADRQAHEGPQHRVTFARGFWMGACEVTQAQWQGLMGNNPSRPDRCKGPNRPVGAVTWHDCRRFCRELSRREHERQRLAPGYRYSLPTEAQWEYACRAGTTTTFGCGDDASRLGDYAWYRANQGKAAPRAGLKKPNDWGLLDMHGNLMEWCLDLWNDSYATAPSDGSAWFVGEREYRVVRGGSWADQPVHCRSATRNKHGSLTVYRLIGFRVVLSCEKEPTMFDVSLRHPGPDEAETITALLGVTSLVPEQAKDLVDTCPKTVRSGLSRAEADHILSRLVEAGADAVVGAEPR